MMCSMPRSGYSTKDGKKGKANRYRLGPAWDQDAADTAAALEPGPGDPDWDNDAALEVGPGPGDPDWDQDDSDNPF